MDLGDLLNSKHRSSVGVSKLIVSTVHRDADEDDSVSVQ